MVITRENPVVIRQKNMIMKSKHTDTKIPQNTKAKGWEMRNNGSTHSQKTVNKMEIVKSLLLIIILNIKELNSNQKTECLNGIFKKCKRSNNILPATDSL